METKRGRPKLPPGEGGSYKEDRKQATTPRTGRPKEMIDPTPYRFLLEQEMKTGLKELYGIKSAEMLRNLIAAHLATATEAKQPIQGALLLESGWVKQDDGGATDWYNKSLVEVDENRDPCAGPSYYYLDVLYGEDDEIFVYIVMDPGGGRHVPDIETMQQLEGLYNILWQGERDD